MTFISPPNGTWQNIGTGEFTSQQTCEAAQTEITKGFRDDVHSQVLMVCVGKDNGSANWN